MMNRHTSRVEDFSAGYYLVNDTNVVPYNGERVIATAELINDLTQHVKVPVVKIGDGHYTPDIEAAVPADTVAVPDSYSYDDEAPLLLAKDGYARDLLIT
jgi:hypothetical protein